MRLLTCLALLGLAACHPAPVSGTRFRTLQRANAFERTVASVETQLGGVLHSTPSSGVIQSKWTDPSYGIGIPPKFLFYRYQVVVLQNPADDSADVRVTPEVVYCGILDSRDPDKMSNSCARAEDMAGAIIPDAIRERIAHSIASLQDDVFRRD